MFALSIPALLIITILASWGKAVLGGYYAKRVPDAARFRWLFGLIQSVFCGLAITVLLALSGGLGTVSVTTVILGVILGLANIITLVTNLAALERGPFSYTTVLISLSAVIPALCGPFFGETVTPVQYAGVALMIVCLFLSPERKTDENKKASLGWLALCGISAVSNGALGVTQKIHQNSAYKSEMAALLIVAFAVASVFSAVMMAVESRKRKVPEAEEHDSAKMSAVWITAAVSGAIFAFPHTINLFLSGAMPAVIMFPLVNLCPMLLSMVTGILLFRERLSPMRWAGVAVGILSTVLVSGVLG